MHSQTCKMFAFLKLCLVISGANAANILGVVLTPSYSHQIVFKPLWRELSLRGHQVTTITTHPIKDPKLVNLTEIDLSFFLRDSDSEQFIKKHIEVSHTNFVDALRDLYNTMSRAADHMLDYGPVKELINDQNAHFDLLIVEYLLHIPLAFAHRFNCPSIGMLSVDGTNSIYKKVGNPTHSSLYPDSFLPYGNKLSLSERVISFVYNFVLEPYIENELTEIQQKIVTKHFGGDCPPIQDLASNISMLFVDSDPIFHHNRPLVPAVVQIGGGSHRSSPKPLPKDLQLVLDKATNGFIYFSLGSNMRSEFLPANTVDMILEVFGELPYTVLWKFGEEISNKPSNVIISKWLPQQDVLRHPNIKLFITQGGLQSMDEAIYSYVPMIGIPFFGDQSYNVKKLVNKGLGLELNYRTLERKQFKETILEVINNPSYRNTIKKLAELAQDQPMSGTEKAVWWTEYVLRHKGAKHLRSPLLDIPWYQYLLIDVIGVLLLSLSVTLFLIMFAIRTLVRLAKRKLFVIPEEKKSS
ncbi:hypothetical protein RI129_010321 [Pyrocoelia pectoralis]|uniref:UDP-glucuronosyltransferase n=1 Tax=Pyrocoelia pectoralis TaxID=417401 RepID=A0AAN7VD86_9COLE